MPKTTDALAILKAITPDDPEMADLLKAAALNAELAQIIYAARTQAGLTQKQLADRMAPNNQSSHGSKTPTTKATLYPCSKRSPMP